MKIIKYLKNNPAGWPALLIGPVISTAVWIWEKPFPAKSYVVAGGFALFLIVLGLILVDIKKHPNTAK